MKLSSGLGLPSKAKFVRVKNSVRMCNPLSVASRRWGLTDVLRGQKSEEAACAAAVES